MTRRAWKAEAIDASQDTLRFPVVRGETTCVVEWRRYHGTDKLFAYWPDFRIGSYFRDWPSCLAQVLHPMNAHVHLRVRGLAKEPQ
jgi:hypothetical protein